jgi:hypothetical protein
VDHVEGSATAIQWKIEKTETKLHRKQLPPTHGKGYPGQQVKLLSECREA